MFHKNQFPFENREKYCKKLVLGFQESSLNGYPKDKVLSLDESLSNSTIRSKIKSVVKKLNSCVIYNWFYGSAS